MDQRINAPTAPIGLDPQAFGESLGQVLGPLSKLNLPFERLAEIQAEYLSEATELWNRSLSQGPAGEQVKDATHGAHHHTLSADRRFAHQEWAANPVTAHLASIYLLNARTLLSMAESIEGDEKLRARIRFAVQQWLDAASPSNFLAFNPEALRRALETKGQSVAQGMQHMLEDLRRGHMSQTDESVFEVGRNVATSEGAVIFENELFQLVEYKPLTAKIHEQPLLIVPPCINKFYILDLQPENSVVRYAVEQGHRVFMLSWRNADESMAKTTWDDYIEDGAIQAIRVVQAVSGHDQINTLGFCIGGTILSTALAVLAARGEQPSASLTLLTSFLDFSNTGVIDIFVDEHAVQMREMTIGEKSPAGGGLLRGQELASTFSFLRPNDLVWNYVVGNYLKGEMPPPFDLLYWNSDSTNLPGPAFCWYLRNTYLENNLKVPDKTVVCGEPVDLGLVEAPVFIYASREDHIVPWDGAYASTQILKGKKRFVLGASGHIAGVINPPAKKKRSYWTNTKLPADHHDWLEGATEHPGSWWTEWSQWLATHAGKQVAAPKGYGNRSFKPIEPAPGRYVKQKA